MNSFTRASERASYSRSKHGSFNDGSEDLEAPPKRRWWRSCWFLVIVGIVSVLFLLFVVGLITWLILKPRYPTLELSDIAISSVKVSSGFSGLSVKALLSMNITAHLTVTNPNRYRISYNPTDVSMSYKDMFVGNSTIPSFNQPAKGNTTLQGVLVVDELDVLKGNGVALLKDAASNSIPFTVVGNVNARVHLLGSLSPKLKVALTCAVVVQPETHTLGRKHCQAQWSLGW